MPFILLLATFTALAPARIQRLGPAPSAPAGRVITLAPSLTEMVLSLAGKDVLVGVSRFDEFPEVEKLQRVGGFVDPNIETILGLKSDLLVVQPGPGNQKPIEKLASLGQRVLALPLHSVEDVRRAFLALGEALGHPEQARKKVASLDAARALARSKSRKLASRSVLIVYGFHPLVVAGPGSFAHELLADVGATNAATEANVPYAMYSVEAVVKAKPDLVLDCSNDPSGAKKFLALPGMNAVRLITPPTRDLMHPGPALERALGELFHLIHPT